MHPHRNPHYAAGAHNRRRMVSRYMPHQGEREKARRVRQMAAKAAKQGR